jgi:hypothetical protein
MAKAPRLNRGDHGKRASRSSTTGRIAGDVRCCPVGPSTPKPCCAACAKCWTKEYPAGGHNPSSLVARPQTKAFPTDSRAGARIRKNAVMKWDLPYPCSGSAIRGVQDSDVLGSRREDTSNPGLFHCLRPGPLAPNGISGEPRADYKVTLAGRASFAVAHPQSGPPGPPPPSSLGGALILHYAEIPASPAPRRACSVEAMIRSAPDDLPNHALHRTQRVPGSAGARSSLESARSAESPSHRASSEETNAQLQNAQTKEGVGNVALPRLRVGLV